MGGYTVNAQTKSNGMSSPIAKIQYLDEGEHFSADGITVDSQIDNHFLKVKHADRCRSSPQKNHEVSSLNWKAKLHEKLLSNPFWSHHDLRECTLKGLSTEYGFDQMPRRT